MRRALVVEAAGDRGALALSRGLAAAGWAVGAATTAHRGLADASRSVVRRHPVPGPGSDLDGFVEAIATAVREGEYEVVLPGASDAVLIALSLRREEIPAALPLPEHDRVIEASDKLGLAEAARRSGLRSPRTVPAEDRELARFPYPAVIKERRHAVPMHDRVETSVVNGPDEAASSAAAIRASGGTPVLQEHIEGRLGAIAVVADRGGRLVARVQQVSERTWPRDAGVSARARTVEVDPSLAEGVEALVHELEWFGLAEAQFVMPEGGEPSLIDFNGRGYGSLALAVAAGANLPAIWADLGKGERSGDLPAATPGARYQWAEGDLRAALAEGSGRVRRLADCIRYSRGAAHSIWSPRDPRPAGRYLRLRATAMLRRLRPARRTASA